MKFEPWQPRIRIEPRVQLEYRNPLLLRDEYEDADTSTGPAQESLSQAKDSLQSHTGPAAADAVAAECDLAVGNTTETEENTEKAGPRV